MPNSLIFMNGEHCELSTLATFKNVDSVTLENYLEYYLAKQSPFRKSDLIKMATCMCLNGHALIKLICYSMKR